MLREEWYILGNMNINSYQCGQVLGEEKKNIIKVANKISSERIKYLEFCKNFGLKQIIKSLNRVAFSISTLTDHIITNTNEKRT